MLFAWTTLDICSVLKKIVLISFFLRHPYTWLSALRLGLALALKRSTVRIDSDGVRLFSGTSQGTGIWCAVSGLQYEKELPIFLSLLRPGQVFIDIGANIGTYTIRAAQILGTFGRVVAFEPLNANRTRLIAAIDANQVKNVKVVQAAIGDRDATVTIHDAGRASSASIGHTTGRAFVVQMVTLDRYATESGLQQLDWIKMDIEGAEPLALLGMLRTIKTFRPRFLFENETGGAEATQILAGLDYVIGSFTKDGSFIETSSGGNLFALPRETMY